MQNVQEEHTIIENSFLFEDYPMPPSSNKLYPTGKTGRRHKSEALREYHDATHTWYLRNLQIVRRARPYFRDQNQVQNNMIQTDLFFGFYWNTLFTKAGVRRKMDVSNRVKALHDTLSTVLMIDDRYFSIGACEPVIIDAKESECVTIRIQTKKICRSANLFQTILKNP